MASMTRSVRIMGDKVSITFHRPTNEEYNTYSNEVQQVVEDENEEGLVKVRCRYFDQWAETVSGIDKAEIFDRHKSSIMYQIFERVGVEEKN